MNQNFVKSFDFFLDLGIVGSGILSREDQRIYLQIKKIVPKTLALK